MNRLVAATLWTVMALVLVGCTSDAPGLAVTRSVDPGSGPADPTQGPGLMYSVKPNPARPNDDLIATLRNIGDKHIEYGLGFVIHRRTGGDGWKVLKARGNCGWELIGYDLGPGEFDQEEVGRLGRRCEFTASFPARIASARRSG